MVSAVFPSPTRAPAARHPLTPLQAAHAALARQTALADGERVRRFNAGDPAAFVEIVACHRARMYRLAFGLLRNRADAEEVAQDTFIRAHRGLVRFRGDSSLVVWLHRIAVNLSRNRHRQLRSHRQHLTASLDCPVADGNRMTYVDLVASSGPGPERELATREFSTLVARCTARLTAGQREVLILRAERQQCYGTIARTLGISVGTVKSRVARARRHLRQLLAETYAVEPPHAAARPICWFESQRPAGLILAATG